MFTQQSNLPSLAAKVDRWKLSQDLIGTYAVLVFERLPLSSVTCQPLLTKTTFHWFPRLSLKTLSKPHVSLLTMSCWHDLMFWNEKFRLSSVTCYCTGQFRLGQSWFPLAVKVEAWYLCPCLIFQRFWHHNVCQHMSLSSVAGPLSVSRWLTSVAAKVELGNIKIARVGSSASPAATSPGVQNEGLFLQGVFL